jgi:hypothetical protein
MAAKRDLQAATEHGTVKDRDDGLAESLYVCDNFGSMWRY